MNKLLSIAFVLTMVLTHSYAMDGGVNLPKMKKPLGERIYIDEDDLKTNGDCFHIHVGGNEWIETHSIHRDKRGLFTYESKIKGARAGVYEKSWKCPYCHSYWPIKTKCQNPDCPSKYLVVNY
jgi:hypothetical protein